MTGPIQVSLQCDLPITSDNTRVIPFILSLRRWFFLMIIYENARTTAFQWHRFGRKSVLLPVHSTGNTSEGYPFFSLNPTFTNCKKKKKKKKNSLPGAQILHSHYHFSVVEYTKGKNKTIIKTKSSVPCQIRKAAGNLYPRQLVYTSGLQSVLSLWRHLVAWKELSISNLNMRNMFA